LRAEFRDAAAHRAPQFFQQYAAVFADLDALIVTVDQAAFDFLPRRAAQRGVDAIHFNDPGARLRFRPAYQPQVGRFLKRRFCRLRDSGLRYCSGLRTDRFGNGFDLTRAQHDRRSLFQQRRCSAERNLSAEFRDQPHHTCCHVPRILSKGFVKRCATGPAGAAVIVWADITHGADERTHSPRLLALEVLPPAARTGQRLFGQGSGLTLSELFAQRQLCYVLRQLLRSGFAVRQRSLCLHLLLPGLYGGDYLAYEGHFDGVGVFLVHHQTPYRKCPSPLQL